MPNVNENGYRYRMVRISSLSVLSAVVALALPFGLVSCSGADKSAAAPTTSGACPTTPVDVVVSVDQWGDIASELGGDCARVKTLLASSSVDPHDYEPTPADAASFEGAQLVVVNGAHYDEWAAKLAATSAPNATVVSAATDDDAQNPHVWYDPAAVTGLADRLTAELSKLAPDAAGYFADRRSAFADAMKPYDSAINALRAAVAGRTYAATEGVFDDMAAAVGLQNRTPPGYQAAARNETDPSPADLDAFLSLLKAQTEGAVPQQLRSAAESAGVPVVNVTETVAPGAKSFEAWQVDQLTALAGALGVHV